MNEEELTEKLNTEKDIVEAFNNGFQKGKLEERERINKIIDKLDCKGETHGFRPKWIDAEQLQKEIGEEKQDE